MVHILGPLASCRQERSWAREDHVGCIKPVDLCAVMDCPGSYAALGIAANTARTTSLHKGTRIEGLWL